MQKLRALSACFVASLLLLANITPASASPGIPKSRECYGFTPHNRDEAFQNVAKVIHSLGRQKNSAASIAQKLATNCGLEIVSEPVPSVVTPATTNQSVTLSNPEIVYYPDYRVWSAFADWQWNSIPTSGEASIGCLSPCNIGGNDGIGIAFSRPVTVVDPNGPWSVSANSKNYYFSTFFSTTPSDGNSTGASFTGQDKLCLSKSGTADCSGAVGENDYSWYSGTLVMNITNIGCGTIQAFSKYAHSWSSTAVNGIGIGIWEISVQWSKTENQWEAVGPPSQATTPCT